MGLGVLGSVLGGQSAKEKADAANKVLADNIKKQEGFYDTNKSTFDANTDKYTQPNQAAQLQSSQDTRGNANVANITTQTADNVPVSGDAPAAVKGEIAKRLLGVHTAAVDHAKQLGKLGGYSDSWFKNQTGNTQAQRDIDFTNGFSESRKALLAPEQQLAMQGTGNEMWGPLLTGLGSAVGSFAGRSRAPGVPMFSSSSLFTPTSA